jgi:ATP-dependent DNA helicase RecG
VLLFHPSPEKYIFGAVLRIGYFRSESDLVHQDDLSGSLLEQVETIQEILKIKYLKAYVSFDGFQRKENFLYPDGALREAILNAVIHKDYAAGIPIQIKVFDNMIQIYNSGVMPEDWTIENLLQPHASRPYNPLIAGAFYRSGEIDSWGRGIQKITESCKTAGLAAPEYKYFSGSGFSLRLDATDKYNRLSQVSSHTASPAELPDRVGKGRESSRERIIASIKDNPTITTLQLAQHIGISSKGVEKQLKVLRDKGILKRIGGRSNGHWELNEGQI